MDVESTLTNSRLWHIASAGKEIEKETLNHHQVVHRCCCLTTCDFEILQKDSVEGFCFRQSNKSLLLACEKLVLIWNSSACYVSYDDISSKRFQDFVTVAKAWVSNRRRPFENSLVIRAALHLIYEGVQDQVQKLKNAVEDSCCWPLDLRELGEKGSLLSSQSKKVMAGIFGEVGGVAALLERNQLLECKEPWNTIPEQLNSIRALLNAKLLKLKTRWVWCVVLGLLIAAVIMVSSLLVSKPISLSRIRSLIVPLVLLMSLFSPLVMLINQATTCKMVV